MIPPGSLVKFCKPEHNLLDRCNTIRFGTLEYYRELDPSFTIADADEGKESTDIGLFEFGSGSPEASEVVSRGMPWIPRGPNVRLQNCAIHTIFPNCYIWCCSVFPKPVPLEYGKNFDQQYTSCYTVTNPIQFLECLAGMLNNFISINRFADSIRETVQDFSIREVNEIILGVFTVK